MMDAVGWELYSCEYIGLHSKIEIQRGVSNGWKMTVPRHVVCEDPTATPNPSQQPGSTNEESVPAHQQKPLRVRNCWFGYSGAYTIGPEQLTEAWRNVAFGLQLKSICCATCAVRFGSKSGPDGARLIGFDW